MSSEGEKGGFCIFDLEKWLLACLGLYIYPPGVLSGVGVRAVQHSSSMAFLIRLVSFRFIPGLPISLVVFILSHFPV